MDIDLGGMIGSAASGGLLGLGGALASQVVGYLTAKQQAKDARAAKVLDFEHEKSMAQLAQTGAAVQQKGERALARIQGDIQNLAASIGDQTALNARVSGWAADALALFRPALTLILVLGALILAVMTKSTGTFEAIAGLAGMAVAWWFGSRDHHKRVGGA